MFPEDHNDFPPLSEPGIVEMSPGIYAARRAPHFRPGRELRGIPGVYRSDIVPIISTLDDEIQPIGQERLEGAEIETTAVSRDGLPFDLYDGGIPMTASAAAHPELFRSMHEVDSPPRTTSAEAIMGLKTVLRDDLAELQALTDGEVRFDPAAARMQDIPTEQDYTPNPYVETQIDHNGPKTRFFVGTGKHGHYDIPAGAIPVVSRYIRVLTPILNAPLLAAPHGFGEVTPELGEVLDNDELREYDGQQPQSIRYPTRYGAMPDGGVGHIVAFNTIDEEMQHADVQTWLGTVSNPARHLGQYADVRDRIDPPTPGRLDHPGRIEICSSDTAAIRFETLIDNSQLTRNILDVFELVAKEGEEAIHRLHANYPHLFGPSDDVDVFAGHELPKAHHNHMQLAYVSPDGRSGGDILIYDGNGKQTTVRNQLRRIVDFLEQEGHPLDPDTIQGLEASMVDQGTLIKTMRHYRDDQGLPSLRGYYLTGQGTPAQWMLERAQAQLEQGKTEEAVMRDGTEDRAGAFQDYLEDKL